MFTFRKRNQFFVKEINIDYFTDLFPKKKNFYQLATIESIAYYLFSKIIAN